MQSLLSIELLRKLQFEFSLQSGIELFTANRALLKLNSGENDRKLPH